MSDTKRVNLALQGGGFLEHLFRLGRVAATKRLASTFDDIGAKSSIDIRARFLT